MRLQALRVSIHSLFQGPTASVQCTALAVAVSSAEGSGSFQGRPAGERTRHENR
jgi:hypothetical protein